MDPIRWNPYNKVVQDHQDGKIFHDETNYVRGKLGLPIPWTSDMGIRDVRSKPVEYKGNIWPKRKKTAWVVDDRTWIAKHKINACSKAKTKDATTRYFQIDGVIASFPEVKTKSKIKQIHPVGIIIQREP